MEFSNVNKKGSVGTCQTTETCMYREYNELCGPALNALR